MSAASVPNARRIPWIAGLLALSNLSSAGLGYLRESIIADMFGAGAATDAYFSAFRLPDLLNYFLAGGALSIAFLPRYTELFVESREAADRFLGKLLGTLGAIVVGATVLLWWQAQTFVELLFSGFDGEVLQLTTHLTRIVLPAQIFFIVGGMLKVALFARDRFLAAALAPLIYNLCIIGCGWALAGPLGIDGFAWGVLLGAILGPFGAPLIDCLPRLRWHIRFAANDPDLRAAFFMALPLMLGLSLLTVDEWYMNILGARLGHGDVSHLMRARLLMRMPVQVVGGALAAASLPALTRLWSLGQVNELNRVMLDILRAAWGIGLLGAGALFALGEPMTRVLFERGAFTPEDTRAVAWVLSLLAFAVPFFLVQQVAVRAFFARGDFWRPMILSTALALGAYPLYAVLAESHGTVGLAAAGVTSLAVTAVLTLGLARWLHQAPPLGELIAGAARASLAVAPGVAAALVVRTYLSPLMPPLWGVSELLVGGLAFGATAVGGLLLLGDAPTRQVLVKILRRLRLWR